MSVTYHDYNRNLITCYASLLRRSVATGRDATQCYIELNCTGDHSTENRCMATRPTAACPLILCLSGVKSSTTRFCWTGPLSFERFRGWRGGRPLYKSTHHHRHGFGVATCLLQSCQAVSETSHHECSDSSVEDGRLFRILHLESWVVIPVLKHIFWLQSS